MPLISACRNFNDLDHKCVVHMQLVWCSTVQIKYTTVISFQAYLIPITKTEVCAGCVAVHIG